MIVGEGEPLYENVFPPVNGLAGVFVSASSAVTGIEGISGAGVGGGITGAACCPSGVPARGATEVMVGCCGRLVETAG